MQLAISTRKPFSFAQTLTFARRFAPLETNAIIDDTSLTAALAAGGRAWPFELREQAGELVAIVPSGAPSALGRRIADFIGADDDLTRFYACAASDAAMTPVIAELHGLHHVRFLGLEEISVYCTMMQRTPIAMAARMKRAFLERFGHAALVRGHTLYAMPELGELARLEVPAIAAAIKHPAKAERIVTIVRAVAALGESFLRTAPYAEARDALLEIPGIGPFSAGAILLRGLGRTDELPSLVMFSDAIAAVYGSRWNEAAIVRRYGRDIGTWAFYLKTAFARLSDSGTPSCSGMPSRSRAAATGADPRRSRGSSSDRRASPRSSRPSSRPST